MYIPEDAIVTKRVLTRDVLNPVGDNRTKSTLRRKIIPAGTAVIITTRVNMPMQGDPYEVRMVYVNPSCRKYKMDEYDCITDSYQKETYDAIIAGSTLEDETIKDWVSRLYEGTARDALTKVLEVVLKNPLNLPVLLGIDDGLDKRIKELLKNPE